MILNGVLHHPFEAFAGVFDLPVLQPLLNFMVHAVAVHDGVGRNLPNVHEETGDAVAHQERDLRRSFKVS